MNYMGKITSILLFALLSISALGKSDFSSANELYNEESYDSALAIYEDLIDQGYFSMELYFNAGNTCYQLNEIGKAIVYFEKARKLDPDNKDIMHNLTLCNEQVIDKNPDSQTSRASERLLGILGRSPNYWSWSAILLSVTGFIFFTLYLLSKSRRNKLAGFLLGIVSLVLSLLTLILSIIQNQHINTVDSAVIMSQSATLKNSPSEESKNAFILHEGTKVELKSSSGDWYEVIYSDGKIGWIKADEIELI